MMMCCMLGLALGVHAQESVFLQQYREKVKAYNQDIKWQDMPFPSVRRLKNWLRLISFLR